MWTQVQKMLSQAAANSNGVPPVVPLRRASAALDSLDTSKILRFGKQCPLPPLRGAAARIIAVRYYRFGIDIMRSYQLQIGTENHYFLTIAEDDQGQYLSLSRALTTDEQDAWFGRDALSFFTEQSSAKSIRCKVDLMDEGDWAAARYSKTVDWVEGTIAPVEAPRLARTFHYNLLVNEMGDKALEVEHDDVNGDTRVFVTVYRPVEDIASIEDVEEDAAIERPTPPLTSTQAPATAAPVITPIAIPKDIEVPLFREPVAPIPAPQPKQRQDFRRLDEASVAAPIHIERTPPRHEENAHVQPDLPSFLLAREEKDSNYLSLDSVIPPESERVRVGIGAARVLIDHAMRKNVRVRDVLREMLGLESALSDEVIIEMPLTDEDYRTLAMRYKLRPDHRVEIRSRLEEELQTKLGVAKP